MQLDMDALIDGLLPWDLTLTTRFWSLAPSRRRSATWRSCNN